MSLLFFLNKRFALFIFLCFLVLSCISSDEDINMNKRSVTSSCEEMLMSYATLSANFTFCAIRNARPIKLCQECVSLYLNVKEIYTYILQIEDMGGDVCRDQLINLDRLQVVDSGFDYISKLWSRAFCDTCFDYSEKDKPQLKPAISQILNVSSELENCILKFQGTNETCKQCEKDYFQLNDFYNNMRADTGQTDFCMDIVDLMNTTRGNWSGVLGCCNGRKKPEIIFLSISSGVFVTSLLFYVMVFAFEKKSEFPVYPEKRWTQRFFRHSEVDT